MKIEQTFIEGLKIITPQVFFDKRGYFYESYNEKTFKENGLDMVFVQDNESKSDKDVLRGLHFQKPPYCQGKLIRVIKGSVIDVVVDLRKQSKTYGQYYKINLTEENKLMFYIPEGFAHGFLTLKDNTIFSYKCTNFYNKESEGGIMWNDKTLNIDWNVENPIISDKDIKNENFIDFNSPF
ncbi:MAG: dTDP-4-dehydrorhamnose 3,5-epimerase [Bacteroidales bacterium]|jgi:dTDP-4-dehydrorhamnose 3,5-epimerase|nr:dTDP-4-dehydrorhamnose 3,5-epimerase [Bacteroidales bacterium]